ncbi:MAG: phosphatidylglycerophosphatase A family protein [Segetibacter sp.]
MIKLHKIIATFFGIGYIKKGGGTVAAAVLCIIWLLIPEGVLTSCLQVVIALLVCTVGVWSGNVVDAIWGKDSSKVVIDEVAGMMVALLFIPIAVKYVLAGLVLFRIFDIAKPLFIKRMELLPKGWGVMGDDVVAGVYANLLLQVVLYVKAF